ncbi:MULTISPECIES: TonB-dependent receptor domain-containing protein [unclassified Brevundimonas]|uniref:TonB-dependent receptor domain-containing protein n=1 Tax=unclassified Brevundimonas TaxID=2622653 RepID=UPI0025C09707|nr:MULTISPECIES: TonB-dependent receptor [unclassified Brevundimonas]
MTPTRTFGLAGLLASTLLTAPALAWAQDATAPSAPQTPPTDPDAVSTVEDIVVRGRFVPDIKRETSSVANILTAEDIQRSGDSEIGEALARVTGLSIVGDGYVYVRGLGDRYSSIILDGSSLPSPEPLKRVVPLDLFPTSLVSNAVIEKTYAVQHPAEFGGGLIALETRAIPNERFFQFGASIAAETESIGKDGLYWDAGGGLSNIGIADNSLNLPNIIGIDPSLKSFQNNPSMLQAAGRSLRNIWSIDADKNLPDFGFNLSGAEIVDLSNGVRLGAFVAFDYDYQARNREGVRNSFEVGGAFNEQISPEACEAQSDLSNAVGCGFQRGEQEYAMNALGAFGVEFNENHELKLTSLLLRKTRQQTLIERGLFSADPGLIRSFQRLNWIEQQMTSNQLSGKHAFDLPMALDRLTVNWRAAYSTASRDTPYRREYSYRLEPDNVFRLTPGSDSNRTFFSALEDENVEFGVDFTLSGMIADREVILRAGGLHLDRDRDFASRRYSFQPAAGVIITPELRSYVPEIIFSPDNIGGDAGYTLRDVTDPSDFFTADMQVSAGYVSAEAELFAGLRVTGGVRYEDSEQQVNSFIPLGETGAGDAISARLAKDYWLPAVTATWEFADNMQLRFGYSQTINRPDLRELSNALFLDDDSNTLERGNPNLQIAEIQNYDLRWEWYFAQRQSATIGLFYKSFDNPIERTYQPIGEGFGRSFQNAEEATLMGVEAEVDYTLPMDQWAPNARWFDENELFVVANVTWTDSEVTDASYTRALQGQSEWLGNLQFGFENTTARRRATLLVNYQGERISDAGIITGTTRLPDVVETPPILLDLVASQTFTVGGRDYDIGGKIENILGEEYERSQSFANGGKGVVESYKLGTTFSLSLSTTF